MGTDTTLLMEEVTNAAVHFINFIMIIYPFRVIFVCVAGVCPTLKPGLLKSFFTGPFNDQIKCCSRNLASLKLKAVQQISVPHSEQDNVIRTLSKQYPDEYKYIVFPESYSPCKFAFGSMPGKSICVKNEVGGMLSVFMHEFGHNLGFGHSSRDGKEYGDVTGYMGYSGGNSTFPRKCYNSYNNFISGWYDSTISYSKKKDFSGELKTFFMARNKSIAIINNDPFYLQFNKKVQCNKDQNIDGDSLIVVRKMNNTSTQHVVSLDEISKIKYGRYTLIVNGFTDDGVTIHITFDRNEEALFEEDPDFSMIFLE